MYHDYNADIRVDGGRSIAMSAVVQVLDSMLENSSLVEDEFSILSRLFVLNTHAMISFGTT